MMKIRYALFDLDGTLTASAPGITRSVQYALSKLGIEEPDLAKLEDFVGPPLSYSFDRHYHLSESDIVKAVEYFRERYAVTGIFENDLYPGIDEMMREASRCGVHTAVASSKPEEHVLTEHPESHLKFLPSDFKKKGGFQRSIELSHKYGLYRQNYCGCEFSKRGTELHAEIT